MEISRIEKRQKEKIKKNENKREWKWTGDANCKATERHTSLLPKEIIVDRIKRWENKREKTEY